MADAGSRRRRARQNPTWSAPSIPAHVGAPKASQRVVSHVRRNSDIDIPIEPSLLPEADSAFSPQLTLNSLPEISDSPEEDGVDNSGAEASPGQFEDPDSGVEPSPSARPLQTRGSHHGRPRGRPRGSRYGLRSGTNPPHVHEQTQTPAKGSRPRGAPKGVKRGPRKPVEPSDEFKNLMSAATLAYMAGRFDEAQELVEQAISLNPEIYSAYALLSSIYQERGEGSKAVAALFQGAHTRPRHTDTWNSVAGTILQIAPDRRGAVADAIYCYNRSIQAEPNNFEARYGRAQLYLESGRYGRAIHDYKHLFKQDRHDLEILRLVSESFSLNNQPVDAIAFYDEAISFYRDEEIEHRVAFWSDANIYAELHLMSEQYAQGITRVKQLARWILRREHEEYWNDYFEDDREFDDDDYPRRIQVAQFEPNRHTPRAYGLGVPLELRVKLGLFRLKLDAPPHDEAMRHFSWLDPAAAEDEDLVSDYPDLIREVAHALQDSQHYRDALRFFEPLKAVLDSSDMQYHMSLGHCYEQLAMYNDAERSYRIATEDEIHRAEALEALAKMFIVSGEPDRARSTQLELSRYRRKQRETAAIEFGQGLAMSTDPDVPMISIEEQGIHEDSFDPRMLAMPPKQSNATLRQPENLKSLQKKKLREDELLTSDLSPVFQALQALENEIHLGSQAALAEWITVAKPAIDHFQAYRPFWPAEKHAPFTGYPKRALERATMLSSAEGANSQAMLLSSEIDDEVPDQYCGVRFADWLSCLLRFAMRTSHGRSVEELRRDTYEICKSTAECSVWTRQKEAQFVIHLVWSICAAAVQDHETLCHASRFFMKHFQFTTDAYRLYGAFHRICNVRNHWYNASPSQKFTLRQIKAMDLCLTKGEGKIPSLYDERVRLNIDDDQGVSAIVKEPDAALLMLYGHMLYAAASYAYAVHYFYRAHALEPDNPMILLSLALGYTHHSTKRQSENRHALITCGLSFLFRYYDLRHSSGHALHQQEAEYNVGKMFHFLGLLNQAMPYYKRCMALSPKVQKLESVEERNQDFAREAAYALRGIYAQAGNSTLAREVTNKWLQI